MSYPTKKIQPKNQLITIKCGKFKIDFTLYPKTWLSRVQASNVLQFIQKKNSSLKGIFVSRIEQYHNYGEESLLIWKHLPHKSPRNLEKEESEKCNQNLGS